MFSTSYLDILLDTILKLSFIIAYGWSNTIVATIVPTISSGRASVAYAMCNLEGNCRVLSVCSELLLCVYVYYIIVVNVFLVFGTKR